VDDAQLYEWKKTYGQVYSVNVRGEEYVFRQLTFDEFDAARRSGASTAEAEEELVAQVLLQPESLPDNAPAGAVTAIAETLFEVSGFGSPQRMKAILDGARQAADGNVWVMMKAVVLATMPGYVEEDLNELTFDQLAAKVALSEQIFRIQQSSIGIEGPSVMVDILDPEEEALKAEREKQVHAAAKKPGAAGYDDPIAARLHDALR
jgi:hypothetical protein